MSKNKRTLSEQAPSKFRRLTRRFTISNLNSPNLQNSRNRILTLVGRGGKGHFVSSAAHVWNRKGRW